MKKFIFIFIIFALFMVGNTVYAASDYYKDITITFNHDGCDQNANKEVTIQLFRDGKKVDGGEVTLNSTTGYTYTYEDLLIFKPESPDQYRYEVKLLENGEYKLISEKRYSNEIEHIQKWVQVLPEDIKAGHTYVITTDNWNYESNGFSKIIYLRGDVTAKGAAVLPEFNIINGKPSYYVIDGEPIENTKWTVSKVPTSDPYYNEYKDYLIFTNESGEKNLVLTGYDNNGSINYIFRHSGKSGYNASENSWNSNRFTLTYVPDSKGRFYIGTHTLWDNYENEEQYLTLSGQNQYQAGSDIARAAQFKAYEYVDMDVEVGVTVYIEESLCDKDTVVIDTHSDYKRNIEVHFDCKGCENKKDTGVLIQLFQDGVKVEDGDVTLNSETGFDYIYENLPVFHEDSLIEYDYQIKALINGKYYDIPEADVSLEKETIKRWVQILPEDVKAGHTYAIITENLNYETNGYSRYVYLRGDITAKGAAIETEYNVIDNKKTYYTLNGNPIENALWTTSSVPTSDPYYNEFKNYLIFTNESGEKNLVLTGYNNGGTINYMFKYSGKDGYNSSEDSWNTNKVLLTSIPNSKGLFYISTHNVWDNAEYNTTQYLSLNNQNQYQASSDINNAAQFMIYEYVEKDIVVASKVVVKTSLCEVLERANPNNPKTGYSIGIIVIILTILGSLSVVRIVKNKLV